MKVGDEITVSLPDWLSCKTGKIVKVLATQAENYYVVEFPNGEMFTYKESELPKPLRPEIEEIQNYLKSICIPLWNKHDFSTGYIYALWNKDYIDYREYLELRKWISNNIKRIT